MKLGLFVFALLYQRPLVIQSQSTGNAGNISEAPAGWENGRFPTCGGLSKTIGGQPRKVAYNNSVLVCVQCKRHWSLVPKTLAGGRLRKKACKRSCLGVLCSSGYCERAGHTSDFTDGAVPCLSGREDQYSRRFSRRDDSQSSSSQIPLIAGFSVGAILMAVVAIGVFLGRYKRKDDVVSSEVVTTPLSLSISEWHSNGGSAGSRRREENLRVEEASTQDLITASPYTNQGKKTEQDDASSFGEGSFRSSNFPAYYLPFPDYPCPSQSNRSSDVILDDGYVTGGHFVGSVDPQLQAILNQNSSRSPKNLCEEELKFFDGQTPGSMTHDAICMSLSHSGDQYHAVECATDGQYLAVLSSPTSCSRRDWTPPINGGARVSQTSEDDTMELSLHFADTDSDFEDHESRLNSNKTEIFSSSGTQSPDGGRRRFSKSESSRTVSQCSESGIEVSCHSKDSCESGAGNGDFHSQNLHSASISWNENRKGHTNERFLGEESEKRNNILAGGTGRSKSCLFKSPDAPTHFSSRKQSVPLRYPSSAPMYFRPSPNNLTHVFVDVHRSMADSDENLSLHGQSNQHCNRNPSFSNSDASSFDEICSSRFLSTPCDVHHDLHTAKDQSPKAVPEAAQEIQLCFSQPAS